MKNTIEKTMTALRADHRNMTMLLDALDAETQRLVDNNEPDFGMMDAIMAYMGDYPDAVHHPKEDLIYRHIRSYRPDVENSLRHIEADHKALAAATLYIRRELDAIAPNENPDCDLLISALSKYSRDLREHMYWEEKDLFALADDLHDNKAWVELLVTEKVPIDPLFGNSIERKYRRLFAHIQQRIVWDCQRHAN